MPFRNYQRELKCYPKDRLNTFVTQTKSILENAVCGYFKRCILTLARLNLLLVL